MTLEHFLGLDSQNSREYMFWSGFGGDLVTILLTGAPIVWGIILFYRHNKCHQCFRLGHHVPHLHYPVCKKHVTAEFSNA